MNYYEFPKFQPFPKKEKYKTKKEKHFFLEVPVFSTNKDPSKQVSIGTIHMSHVFRNWTQRRVSSSSSSRKRAEHRRRRARHGLLRRLGPLAVGKEAARLCCGRTWTMARLAVARGPLAMHVHGEEASRAAACWHRWAWQIGFRWCVRGVARHCNGGRGGAAPAAAAAASFARPATARGLLTTRTGAGGGCGTGDGAWRHLSRLEGGMGRWGAAAGWAEQWHGGRSRQHCKLEPPAMAMERKARERESERAGGRRGERSGFAISTRRDSWRGGEVSERDRATQHSRPEIGRPWCSSSSNQLPSYQYYLKYTIETLFSPIYISQTN
jgi:hypothetical protein